MVRLLFLLCSLFLFLSSSTAALMGLQNLRVVLFSLLFAAIIIAAITMSPRFSGHNRELPLILLWLLAVISLFNVDREFHAFDYKIILPILAIFIAPNIGDILKPHDLPRLFFRLLAVYIFALLLSAALGSDHILVRGTGTMLRFDLSGSIVAHASLCAIAGILAVHEASAGRGFYKILAISVAAMACMLVMLTATRSALFTIVIFAALSIIAGPNRHHQIRSSVIGAIALVSLFTIYTAFFSDSYLMRLIGSEDSDYSSGRYHSLIYWLTTAANEPFGHGMGTVRDIMQHGRPYIENGLLLEWPHNAFVRFYVEAGIPGLALVIILTVGMTRKALRAAASQTCNRHRALILILTADMWSMSLLQNYFNMVYHATILLLLLAILCQTRSTARHGASTLLKLPKGSTTIPGAGRVGQGRAINLRY